MSTMKKTILHSLAISVTVTAVILTALHCEAQADATPVRAYGGVAMDTTVVGKLGVERQVAAPRADLTLHVPALVTLPILRPGGGDVDVRAGLRAELRRGQRWLLAGTVSPFVRTTQNVNFTAVGLGVDLEITPTVMFSRLALGLELGYDKSLADNFQHTDAFRERFYAGVHDGWYQGTAASLRAGVRGELRITRAALLRVRAGTSRTEDGNAYLVPLYAEVGTSIAF